LKALIAYGTRYGATTGTSEEIAKILREEGEEKDVFAYDAGIKLGMETRRVLEENWRNYVMAGMIAAGCSLLLISLKSTWVIVGLSAFISYGIAYYSLSRLFAKKDGKSINHRRSLDVQYSS